MKDLAQPALNAVNDGEVKLFPDHYKNTWNHWLENVHDWNISRQLWWGHQIPAYYYGDGQNDFVVAETREEALKLAQEKTGRDLSQEDLKQDPDALDTWFSSWLWPISVFNGILEPENKDISYYYPTKDLVTAPDIIFFWVARMVMAGYEFRQERPFDNVYFTGIVRDKQRRKMSKSLGNSPDPIELMNKYGADGVRVGLMLSSSAGNDLLFDEDLCLQGRNFANKIWNAFRLIYSWETEESDETQEAIFANDWFSSKFNKTLEEMNEQYEKFRISDALMLLYKMVWDDFCSWYLEAIKPDYRRPVSKKTKANALKHLDNLMKLLHPFMPFITEEIWQLSADRNQENALIISEYPTPKEYDEKIIEKFDFTTQIVTEIRNLRKEKNISRSEELKLFTKSDESFNLPLLKRMAILEHVYITDEVPDYAQSFRVGKQEFYVPLQGKVDEEAERVKLESELEYLQGFLNSVQKKLSNERFVNNAPDNVVEAESKKESDALAKMALIKAQLEKLK